MRPARPCLPLALATCGLAALAGCAGPAIRSQSPEIEALADMEADTQLVGDYAAAWGLGVQRIERAALVTGLAGTGSDPAPGPQRQMLLSDMQERGVVEPNTLLASPATSLAWVHGYLPPGIRKGDRFDVFVEVLPDSETTSLAGGWLMETRLSELAVLGNAVREGRVLGVVEGPLLVDPVAAWR
jgi:flagellar basal body P-ring protein FlgI